jgi:hypothetical protein
MEPGSVAEWVSGIGTLLAFALGLKILFNDRREDQRRHANSLVTWINTEKVADGWRYTFNAHNVGTAPVLTVGFMTKPFSTRSLSMQLFTEEDSILPAGSFVTDSLESPLDPEKTKIYLHFLDADSNVWWRTEGSNKKYLTWQLKWWDFERTLQSWWWTLYKRFTGKNLAARGRE